ncbi:MAG: hemerythrin domain-containing protein [Actinobacteria bacterium]|nr:hemerythrin domain-containing protein [Actinomycetota bacterium]
MCSYCGCSANSIIGRFMDEHVEIINALTDLRAACHEREAERAEAAVAVMAGLLHPHTQAEEVGLFAVLAEDDVFTEHIGSLCSEHALLDDLLDRLADGWFEGFEEFELLLHRHIDREDNGLFPAANIAISGEDWERVVALTDGAS